MNLPASIGWERALLGTALYNPDAMQDAEAVLPSDLTGCHQIIWSEMVSLFQRGSLGPRALIEALRSRDMLDAIGFDDLSASGEHYVSALSTYRGEEIQEYVDRVIDASTKRQLRQVAALIKAEAEDANAPADEVLDAAEKRVMGLRRNRHMDGSSMADLMAAMDGRLNAGTVSGNVWRPSIPELEEVIGFAEPEDFIVIASRPGEGKSSILRYEIGVHAIRREQPALLINMENSEIEVARSFVSMVTGISKSKIKNGGLTDDEKERAKTAVAGLAQSPIYIVTISLPSAAQVARLCRHHISKNKVNLIAVDYVQLMHNGIENRVQDVSMSSAVLRGIALNHGVPVLAACQMSRSIEQRGDNAEPQLSDLRESGSLEQDATIVGFPRNIWRDPQEAQLRIYPENIDGNRIINNAVPVKIHVKKNRNGPIGATRPFLFIKNVNLYRSIHD